MEELLVDGGHPNSNLVGRRLLTEGESKFRSNKVPEIGGSLSHQPKHTNLKFEDKTHPTNSTKFENLLVESVKVDLFSANIQRSLADCKLLCRAEVSI